MVDVTDGTYEIDLPSPQAMPIFLYFLFLEEDSSLFLSIAAIAQSANFPRGLCDTWLVGFRAAQSPTCRAVYGIGLVKKRSVVGCHIEFSSGCMQEYFA